MDIVEAIRRTREGDSEAFCCIVEGFEARIRGYIACFVSNEDDVLDLSQEAFLAAFRRFDTFDPARDLGAWLIGIARKLTVDHLRRASSLARRRQDLLDDAVYRWQSERLQSQEEGYEWQLEALKLCLEELAASARRLVRRRYFEGVSAEDIGRNEKAGASTVRVRLLRIRKALGDCIRRRVELDGGINV